MQLFYANQIKGGMAFLDVEESMHCVKSLRKKEGDKIMFIDGQGSLFEGRLVDPNKRGCIIAIEKETTSFGKRNAHLHIAIAPTKNIGRFEWFLEKATEIGIERITPLICQRSERRKLRIDRFKKIMISAIKQSQKAFLPALDDSVSFKSFLENTADGINSDKFIAHCSESQKHHFKDLYTPGQNALVMIGPEGDFSEEEITLAKEKGFVEINLGESRLRTETAGIVVCSIFELFSA